MNQDWPTSCDNMPQNNFAEFRSVRGVQRRRLHNRFGRQGDFAMNKPSILFSIMAAMLAAEISRENIGTKEQQTIASTVNEKIDINLSDADRIKEEAIRNLASELGRI